MEPAKVLENREFVYLKYWKPAGVTCTSDTRDPTNIITAGRFDLFPQRLFTVGRLDKASTGLILLTSDGRVNNAILNPYTKREKVYEVLLDKLASDEVIATLRSGVVISTTVQRDKLTKDIRVKTLPCIVKRVQGSSLDQQPSRKLQFTLTEGRNRQIRKMCYELGFEVKELHRICFSGLTLKGLSEGNWKELTEKEMIIIQDAVANAAEPGSPFSERNIPSILDQEEYLE